MVTGEWIPLFFSSGRLIANIRPSKGLTIMMSLMNRVKKNELFDWIKSYNHLTIKALQKIFHVSDSEDDRPRLWSIRQQLVELERLGYITLETRNGMLTAFYRKG
jgi:hypothetical protein